jgi:hypothetical protein
MFRMAGTPIFDELVSEFRACIPALHDLTQAGLHWSGHAGGSTEPDVPVAMHGQVDLDGQFVLSGTVVRHRRRETV